jgi:hypothetical protein
MDMVEICEYDRAELVAALSQRGPDLLRRYFRPASDLGHLVRRSVAGNTFRGLVGLKPLRPSVLFREWALSRLSPERMSAIQEVGSRSEYDAFLGEEASHLARFWQETATQPLGYGPQRKLTNLLLKSVCRWEGIADTRRERLIQWLHVPLDQYTLLAVRRFATAASGGTVRQIPRTATMSFVRSDEQYTAIQGVMRATADQAGMPVICVDLLAWDHAHAAC